MTLAPGEPGADPFAVREVRVRQKRWEAEGVMSLELQPLDGSPVPAWTPGSHIDVVLPSGLVRQYSLCGDPADPTSYTIAVLRDVNGKGGSKEIHDSSLVGETLGIRGPRNHFKLREADSYLLIAGGIGITPILTMARRLDQEGAPYRVLYTGRTRVAMAFQAELAALGGVQVNCDDETGQVDVDAVVGGLEPGTEIWCCGPEGLLRAVEAAGARYAVKVHVERFGTQAPPEQRRTSVVAVAAPAAGGAAEVVGDSFEVELRRSGVTLKVDPDRTILESVREYLPGVISSCEEGFCGACETRVLEGIPDHRDEVLDDTDRATNETMMICVSRSCSPKLVLDL